MILGSDNRKKWSEMDVLVMAAYQRYKNEICPEHGGPLWLCFGGDTEVITKNGTKPIRDLVGPQTLLTRPLGGYGPAHWVDAEIRAFGKQSVMSVTLSRLGETKVIEATPEHRWFVRKPVRQVNKVRRYEHNAEVETRALQPGDEMVSAYTQKWNQSRPSPIGVVAGFTFGDGHRVTNQARLDLYGDKDKALLPYLSPLQHVSTRKLGDSYTDDEGLTVWGLPKSWKDLPSLNEGSAYLRSWLMGYFAADGTVSKTGSARLYCADPATLEAVRDIATACGIGTTSVKTYARKGIRGVISDLSYITLMKQHLSPDFFIIEEHRKRVEANPAVRKIQPWRVVSVEDTGRVEDVYCAVVPGTEAFVLKDNILTGNCRSDDPRLLVRIKERPACYAAEEMRGYEEKHKDDEDKRAAQAEFYYRGEEELPIKKLRDGYFAAFAASEDDPEDD